MPATPSRIVETAEYLRRQHRVAPGLGRQAFWDVAEKATLAQALMAVTT